MGVTGKLQVIIIATILSPPCYTSIRQTRILGRKFPPAISEQEVPSEVDTVVRSTEYSSASGSGQRRTVLVENNRNPHLQHHLSYAISSDSYAGCSVLVSSLDFLHASLRNDFYLIDTPKSIVFEMRFAAYAGVSGQIRSKLAGCAKLN